MSAQELEAKNQKTIALLKQETTEHVKKHAEQEKKLAKQDKKLSELDKKLAEQDKKHSEKDKRNAAVIQQLKEEIAAKQK